MRVYWMLRGGESLEVYDGVDFAKDKVLVYRVGIERFVQAEVKIVRPNVKSKVISRESRSPIIDLAVTGALYLEVVGKDGCAFGWYETIGGL